MDHQRQSLFFCAFLLFSFLLTLFLAKAYYKLHLRPTTPFDLPAINSKGNPTGYWLIKPIADLGRREKTQDDWQNPNGRLLVTT